jgi:hypothetical protein
MGWRMTYVGFDPIQLLPNFSALSWGLAPVQIVLLCMTLFVAMVKLVQKVIGWVKFIVNSDGVRKKYVVDISILWGGTLMIFLCDGLLNCRSAASTKDALVKKKNNSDDAENPDNSPTTSTVELGTISRQPMQSSLKGLKR